MGMDSTRRRQAGPQPAQSTPAATAPLVAPQAVRIPRWGSLHPTYHVLFPVTIFLSAFLLFQVQPMVGRYILPWFGGGPAVWTSCLLFFQACLLAGYAYAHWLGSLANLRLQAGVHVALLLASLAFLPLHPTAAIWKPVTAADPSGRIFLLLTVTVGGPYLLLSATAPLVQRWFTHRAIPQNRPGDCMLCRISDRFWRCLSYPFVFEPSVAAAYARLDLVGVVPGVRGAVRIHRLAVAGPSPACNARRAASRNPRAAPLAGPCCSGSRFPRAVPRFWWRPPIKSRKTSPSARSCGWRALGDLPAHIRAGISRATASTGARCSPLPPGFFAPIACALPTISIGLSLAVPTGRVSDCAVRHLHDLSGRTGAIPSRRPATSRRFT